jgi:transposase
MLAKHKEKNLAMILRKEGKSIKEIAKFLNVSAGSVSIWVKQIKLTEKQKTL